MEKMAGGSAEPRCAQAPAPYETKDGPAERRSIRKTFLLPRCHRATERRGSERRSRAGWRQPFLRSTAARQGRERHCCRDVRAPVADSNRTTTKTEFG